MSIDELIAQVESDKAVLKAELMQPDLSFARQALLKLKLQKCLRQEVHLLQLSNELLKAELANSYNNN